MAGRVGATVTVTNTGTAPTTNGWRVTWNFTAGQVITNLWQATYTQSGNAVTVLNPSGYNAVVNPGQSVTFGFNANSGTSNPVASPVTCAVR